MNRKILMLSLCVFQNAITSMSVAAAAGAAQAGAVAYDQVQLDREHILASCERAIESAADKDLAKQIEMLVITFKTIDELRSPSGRRFLVVKEEDREKYSLYWNSWDELGFFMRDILTLNSIEVKKLSLNINRVIFKVEYSEQYRNLIALEPLLIQLGLDCIPDPSTDRLFGELTDLLLKQMQDLPSMATPPPNSK